MKLTINKLIANDIINYGMDQTSNFNYIISLEEYLKDYDENSQKYILENLEDICDAIAKNENVSFFELTEEDGKKEFDMVFYWGNLMTQMEKLVYDNAKLFNVNLEFEDIREIAENIIDGDEFNDELIRHIKSHDKGQEL